MNATRLWTKEFVVAIIANLFISSVFYLLLTSMAGYALKEFQASDAMAGMASSSFILGAVVSRLLTGKFLDFIGRRRLLVLSMILFLVAGLAYFLVTGLGELIAVRVVHGIAFGAGTTALAASVQSVIPPARRAEGNGYFGTSTTLSTALGPFLALTLSAAYGFDAVFAVATACAAAALVAAFFFTVPERTPSEAERRQLWSLSLGTFINPTGVRIGMIILVAGAAYATILSFLAIYTEASGFGSASSSFFVAYAAASLLVRLFAGRIQDRYGDVVVVVPAFISFFAGMMMVAFASSAAMIIVAGVFMGFGFGSLLPSLQAVLINRVSPAEVGVATSTFFLFLDIGSGLGPVLLGLLVSQWGHQAMYLAAGALVLVAAGGYLGLQGPFGKRVVPEF